MTAPNSIGRVALAKNESCQRDHGAGMWRVLHRNHNHSAFNGYHPTWSDYSAIICLQCRRHWRTKAAYVDRLLGLSPVEAEYIGFIRCTTYE